VDTAPERVTVDGEELTRAEPDPARVTASLAPGNGWDWRDEAERDTGLRVGEWRDTADGELVVRFE